MWVGVGWVEYLGRTDGVAVTIQPQGGVVGRSTHDCARYAHGGWLEDEGMNGCRLIVAVVV